MSKKKKITIIVSVVVVILLVVIIVVAVTTHQQSTEGPGEIASLTSGQGCSGDTSKQSRCKGGTCIQNLFVCDGFDDCPEGEDEVQTSCDKLKKKSPCKADQFQCHSSRTCIDMKQRCDSTYDCGEGDFSDERNCFFIDTDTSKVSVLHKGEEYPMSAVTDNRIAEQICQDLGFKSLQYIIPPDSYANQEDDEQTVITDHCGRVNTNFDPDADIKDSDDELVSHVEIVAQCDKGELRLTCEHDYCGIFGKFMGPPVPDSWTSPGMKAELKKSERRFPWVVDLYQGGTRKCKGTIVSSEWILTADNCFGSPPLGTGARKKTWTVKAASDTSSPQRRSIVKVMRNHFENMLSRNGTHNLVAVQVDPPLILDGHVHQACLALPALLPHFNCLAAGTSQSNGVTQHVRVLPKNATQDCVGKRDEDGTVCFSYPHAGDPSSCLDTRGSPISCLDPATNSWKVSGVFTTDIGCNKKDRLAAFMGDEFNFYWAQAVTSHARVFGDQCGNKAEFKEIRFMNGNREGEVYLDIQGRGSLDAWHTVYDLSSAVDLLRQGLVEGQVYPAVRVTNKTGITSTKAAFLQCPEKAATLCACKVRYKSYSTIYGEAQALHFYDPKDNDKDGKTDIAYENWDEDDNIDNLYEDYEDYQNPEKVSPDEIFSKACESKLNARQCLNGTGCVMEGFICDTTVDCPDGSDEDRDTCEKIHGSTCPDKWFKCKTTYDCIPNVDRCNGVNECEDFSDERDCVSVDDNGIVMVEKSGLALPLAELPHGVSSTTRFFLASALCRYMGFSTSTSDDFTMEDPGNSDFPQGCYKLNDDKFGDDNVMSTDFTRRDSQDCSNYLTLKCEPPGCGVTTNHPGPKGRPGWPTVNTEGGNENHDYPWAVHIKKGEKILCAATIVLPQWVVTTADCVSELTDDLKVVFLYSATPGTHNITHKANHIETQRRTGQSTERNVVMLGVQPEFPLNTISHPLCLIPPLYVSQSLCYVSGHDKDTNKFKHIRVVPRDNQVCRNANRNLTEKYNDQQCVQYIAATDSNDCILAKGSALQCLDRLRDQWKFTAIMTMDIGDSCPEANSSIAAATNTRYLLPWMSTVVDDIADIQNVTCANPTKTISLIYRKSNYENEWYMMTNEGHAVNWTDEETLNKIAHPLITIYAALKVTETRASDKITALRTVTISNCDGEYNCQCELSPEPREERVQKFFLVSVNPFNKDKEEQKFEEEDGVIGNQDFTTPIEFLTSTVTDSPTERSKP